jgi:DNA-binding NtrC family response regulator
MEASMETNASDNPPRPSVLVVDDDELGRTMIVETLNLRNNYKVLQAAGPLDALEILRSTQKIDLLVTDVRLQGGLNGEQMAKAAMKMQPELKVMFVTGYPDDLSVDWTADAATQIMPKPFPLSGFLAKVSSMLSLPAGSN